MLYESVSRADAGNHASIAEVVACFQDEKSLLCKLALLITGDRSTGDQSVVRACEITLVGHRPFRDWLLEWAKVATINIAISRNQAGIRACEDAYKTQGCSHPEHLSAGDAEECAASLNLILRSDPWKIIADLDALCRAVLILRVAIRSSIQDCVLRLNICRDAVVGANCRAMTWLHEVQSKPWIDAQSGSSILF